MKKKFFFTLFILGLIFTAGIIYLNKVILPIKIKSFVIFRLEEATQKKASLQTIEFHLFKGLVLRNLILYDGKDVIVNVKEISCPLPAILDFKKKILTVQIQIEDASSRGFLGYFQNLGASLLNSDLKVNLRYNFKDRQLIEGSLDILDAKIKLDKIDAPIEDIAGRLEFNPKQIKWLGLNFKYQGIPYKTSGAWVDFQNPAVQLTLSSKELVLAGNFTCKDNLITISQCNGQYLNSKFSLKGNIDTFSGVQAPPEGRGRDTPLSVSPWDKTRSLERGQTRVDTKETPRWDADISGVLSIDLKDTKSKINPAGIVHGEFNLNGNIKDIKTCSIMGSLSSPAVSVYGLKATKFFLKYNQADGLVNIAPMHLSLYDGEIKANAVMNLNSKNFPFWLSADIKGIKIEKLKIDTTAKEKDIAGTIAAQLKINGFLSDLNRLNGAGGILVSDGKLWQLNLFKGLGELIFVKEFSQIIFRQASCDFIIQDKYIWTDNLKLKSDFIDLAGSCKLGFDSSIDAALNMEVLDESIPLGGTLKDITTAILGQAGKIAVIKITGTLKEPKYKFQTAVMDIIKGLKDAIMESLPR